MSLREKVGLLAYSPLSFGTLTGKYLDGARPEGARFSLTTRNQDRYLRPGAEEVTRRYVQIAKDAGMDPAILAIAFAANRSFVTSAIIGATSIEQLKTNIAAGDVILSDDLMAAIDAVYKEFPDPIA
jgi:aryl-alcohol dehydrogenase-like predicted oxidoreductase